MRRCLLAVIALAPSLLVAAAEQVDYVKQVKPILAERCFACHGKLKQKSGLRLDAYKLILEGGNDGPAIVPGKSAESRLIHAVTGTNDMELMPSEGGGAPLRPDQIEILKRWIDEGAKAPDEPVPAHPREHWSFQPPVRPELPRKKDKWIRNPIDALIAAEHKTRKLKPQSEAPKHVLLRRVHLDLIGLPPTPDQVDAFVKDSSPDAYERVVDELLASKHYGERWGRHWMDVWRYSDWAGYGMEVRDSQPHVWRWRDWIVDSLNADKPYDRMVQEMLAGDELAPEDPHILAATGYLSRNYARFSRVVWLDNAVEHTGKAFLGVTLNCAKCHDHMFDPISQKEHYAFRAVFEPYQTRTQRVPGERNLERSGLTRAFDEHLDTPTYIFRRGLDSEPIKDAVIAPGVPAVLGGAYKPEVQRLPFNSYYPGAQEFVVKEDLAALEQNIGSAQAELDKAHGALRTVKDKSDNFTAAGSGTPGANFLTDDFNGPRTDIWVRGAGEWAFDNGHLSQTRIGMASHVIASIANHPRDFDFTFRFKITGGGTWHSCGFNFDMTRETSNCVYMSAYPHGPKAQVSWRKGNEHAYPPDGAIGMPVKVGQQYELRVLAKDRLLNVFVDGKCVLIYQLPIERKDGTLELLSFDAKTEFNYARMDALPADAILYPVGSKLPITPVNTAAQALRVASDGVQTAAARQAVARAELVSYKDRAESEKFRFGLEKCSDEHLKATAVAAVRSELKAREARLNAEILGFEQKIAAINADQKTDEASKKALVEAQKKLDENKKLLDDTVKKLSIENPGYDYPPLFGRVYPQTTTGRRLALARWITARENPLAARVAVNHMWLRHFGEGIVPTVFDFGLNGRLPTNQKLIDWLAVEFMESGWSMKALHKLMVLSSTYRMQSTTRADQEANRKTDPDNVYLWRMNTRRMEAEVVRDSVLYTANRLDLTLGGPDLNYTDGLTIPRRSIYFRHALEKQMTFMKVFDCANPVECYRRAESIVPQQALTQANNPVTRATSRLLAAELSKAAGSGDDSKVRGKFIESAFHHVLCRTPDKQEVAQCDAFLVQQAARFNDTASWQTFTIGEPNAVAPASDPVQRARENLVHVLFNHNDFVTIR